MVTCIFELGPSSFFVICMVRQETRHHDVHSPSVPMGEDSGDHVGPPRKPHIPSHLKTLHPLIRIALVRYDDISHRLRGLGYGRLWKTLSFCSLHTASASSSGYETEACLLFSPFNFLHSVELSSKVTETWVTIAKSMSPFLSPRGFKGASECSASLGNHVTSLQIFPAFLGNGPRHSVASGYYT